MDGIRSISMNLPRGVYGAQNSASIAMPAGSSIMSLPASNFSVQDTFIKTTQQEAPAKLSVSKTNGILAAYAPKIYMNKYLNQRTISNAINTNPKIAQILSEKNLSPKINLENVTGKNQEHFSTTYNAVKKLGQNMPESEKNILMQSALMHDIGKALIPAEILNKNGKLTPEEREVVDLHARLGEEIIKTTDIDDRVAKLVGLHHAPCSSPLKSNSQTAQALSVADVYSALKEERPYKKPFTQEQVKEIMTSDNGLNQDMVNSLLANES